MSGYQGTEGSEQVVWFNNPVRVWCVAWQHMWLQPLILLFNEIWQDVSLCAHHMQGVTVQGNKRRIRFVHLIHTVALATASSVSEFQISAQLILNAT